MSDKYLWCVCVCFSGESGAGKTESTKLLLQFLSVMSQNSAGAPEKATCVEKAIMQSRSTHKHINTHATTTQCEKSQFCCSACELVYMPLCAMCCLSEKSLSFLASLLSKARSWKRLETPKPFTTTIPVASESSSSFISVRAGTSKEAASLTVSYSSTHH